MSQTNLTAVRLSIVLRLSALGSVCVLVLAGFLV